jgi:hypothetical protein
MKYKLLILIFCFFFGFTSHIFAAKIYFDPQESTVGTTSPFLVGVLIDSDKSINTFSVSVALPQNMEFVDFSDADSIINFWVDKPKFYKVKNTVYFSGIVPGGFVGDGARILILELRAKNTGLGEIAFRKEDTYVIENSPNGLRTPLSLKSTQILVVAGRENIDNHIPDDNPPENFRPEINKISYDNDKFYLFFQAQDKESGISHYEVAESDHKTSNPDWKIATSPYELSDQSLKSFVYVKAIDKNKNEKVEIIKPAHQKIWTIDNIGYIIGIVFVLIFYLLFYKKLYVKKR